MESTPAQTAYPWPLYVALRPYFSHKTAGITRFIILYLSPDQFQSNPSPSEEDALSKKKVVPLSTRPERKLHFSVALMMPIARDSNDSIEMGILNEIYRSFFRDDKEGFVRGYGRLVAHRN